MTTSTPASRRDEDLPGSSAGGSSGGSGRGKPGKPASRGGKPRNPRTRGPVRTLLAMLVLTLGLFAGIGSANQWAEPAAPLAPQLGLDLAGGRQIVMAPVAEEGTEVSQGQLDQAIDIIRRRVDGTGTAEAEVSRLGRNISVAIPGDPTPEQLESLSRSSQMVIRPVLEAAPAQPAIPEQRQLPLPSQQRDDLVREAEKAREDAERLAEETEQSDGSDAPANTGDAPESRGGTQQSRPPESTSQFPAPDSDLPESGPGVAPAGGIGAIGELSADNHDTTEAPGDDADQTDAPGEQDPAQENPSDLAQITPELQAQFDEMDCLNNLSELARATADAPAAEPTVACSEDGTEKYILGPVEVTGASLTDAVAGPQQNEQGVPMGGWEVRMSFDSEGGRAFDQMTRRLFGYRIPDAPQQPPQNRFAISLDGEIITAPQVQGASSAGGSSITGNFTGESADLLANQLKFGALPLSFEVQTSEQISPTLGGEQLRWGLIAGVIGLLLVFAYMLVQYHALGFVAIASLFVAGILAYGTVTLLGWATNFRLTMAGVTGLIVAIGVTADSFIVYFERIRDEVRSGRPLRYAVDTGWARARRTIIISDIVNLIAAGVLYYLSEAGVKAFAFTLGMVTVIDLLVVMMFTHPLVSILANTRFFGEGRKWSGMEPERLGAKRATYLGRGQVRDPGPIAPGRNRHTREELEGGVV